MKITLQIGVVFVICLLGELISSLIPFPFPSSVIGMVMLFLLFSFKILKPELIRQKTDFMLKNMAIFFVAPCVELLDCADYLKQNGIALLFICVVSTILAFFSAAYTVKAVIALQNKLTGGKRV